MTIMKTSKFILTLFVAIALAMTGCNSITECESIEHTEATILIDVSDPKLFSEIENDLANLPKFMKQTGLGSIKACQKFTLGFAHLSGKEALELSAASISINRKRQSKNAERSQSNPEPLVKLFQKKITDYRQLSEDAKMTAGSNIANVLFKSIIHANGESESVILLFTDGVENNTLINFYKKIPSEADVPIAIEKMIEPAVLEQFRKVQKQGLNTRIVFVLKPEPSNKTSLRDIRTFWTAFFKELKLDDHVQFVDNLTVSIKL